MGNGDICEFVLFWIGPTLYTFYKQGKQFLAKAI